MLGTLIDSSFKFNKKSVNNIMRTLLCTFLIFFVFLNFSGNQAVGENTVENSDIDKVLHTECLYPTIQVSAENKRGSGSGVIVKSVKISDKEYYNIFITACHVISNDAYVVKIFEYENWSTLLKSSTYQCSFYASNQELDLAIGFFISEQEMPTAKIEMDAKFYIGNEVFRIGCGLGDEPRLDYGKITSLRSKIGREVNFLLRTSILTTPGDSGGPLFNKYRLVGIAHSIRAWSGHPVFGMSYYIPIHYLKDWSKDKDGAYDFVWVDQTIPKMPLLELKLSRSYEISRN